MYTFHTHKYTYICTYVHKFLYIYVGCVYQGIYIYIHQHVCVCVCVCVCMYVSGYVTIKDSTAPYVKERWLSSFVLLCIYCLRIYMINGWYIVVYRERERERERKRERERETDIYIYI